MSNKSATCPKCQKPKSKAGSSSITQWIAVCICDSLEALDQAAVEQAAAQELQFCSACNKRINPGRQGSFTQYIFRSDLCNCAEPRPRKATDAERLAQPVIPSAEEEIDDDEIQEDLPLDENNFPIERYKPLVVLGTGSTGTVYLCRDKLLGKRVAVKKLNAASAEQLVAFQLEAKATSRLNHPNIVTVLDFGVIEVSGIPFMVMEYVKGTSLLKHLEEKGRLDIETAVDIVSALCDALKYAHEHRTFHRDVKPSNIILDLKDDGSLDVRLIDFGVATVTSQTLTPGRVDLLVGTPTYMSPDVSSGLAYDARSELYSIGCTLFEMLTGRPPFEGDGSLEVISMHANELPPTLEDVSETAFSAELEAVVGRCLSKLPDDRYQSLDELQQAISDPKIFGELHRESESPVRVDRGRDPKKVLFTTLLLVSIIFGVGAVLYFALLSKVEKTQIVAKPNPGQLIDVLPAHRKVSFDEGFCRIQGGPWERKDLEELAKKYPDITEVRASSEVIADWNAFGVFSKMTRLNLTTCMIKDEQFQTLVEGVPDLVSLEVNNSIISDKAIKSIGKWQSLNHIELCETQIGNEGMRLISQLKNLRDLEVSKSRVTDDGLEYIKNMPLALVSASDCTITDSGAALLSENSNLQVLRLNSTNITDKALELLRKCEKINQLEISHCGGVTDAGMITLAKYPYLNRLQINSTSVTRTGIETLAQSPSLRCLSIDALKLTDEDLLVLQKIQKLTEISISENQVTDKGLPVFLKIPQLNLLVANKSKLTTGGVASLQEEFKKMHGHKLEVRINSRRELTSEDSAEFSSLLNGLDDGP